MTLERMNGVDLGGMQVADLSGFCALLAFLYACTTALFKLLISKDGDMGDGRVLKQCTAGGVMLIVNSCLKDFLRNNQAFGEVFFGIMACMAIMSMLATYYRFVRGKEPEKVDMTGKVVIITGSSGGIGVEAAKSIVRMGAHVILACRSEKKANAAMETITKALEAEHAQIKTNTGPEVKGKMTFLPIELGSLASVRAFVEKFRALKLGLDVLVLNAGVITNKLEMTEDGFEKTFAVNHLGHFALTNLLLPAMSKSKDPRVVVVTSSYHKDVRELRLDDLNCELGYNQRKAYRVSKLANVMHAIQLQRRLLAQKPKSKIAVNAVHPGVVMTEITQNLPWLLQKAYAAVRPLAAIYMKQPEHGAYSVVFAACSEKIRTADPPIIGQYIVESLPQDYNPLAKNPEALESFWDASE
ncbi:unnamed protein product, partial [Chrysoparadoxa australica]